MPVLPTNCAEYVGGPECLSSMTATAVTYEDCGDAFTVCRRPPGSRAVGLRRFVGTVFVLENNATRAYTNLSTGDIHLFGDCAMDTWIHEASHTFDFAFFPSFVPSNTTGWQQAIADDSCVPDSYSLRNRVEDFAQMSVLKIYMLLHNGHLPPGFESACLSHQLDFMGTLPLYNAQNLFGNTCAINDGSFGPRHSKTTRGSRRGQGLHDGTPRSYAQPDRHQLCLPFEVRGMDALGCIFVLNFWTVSVLGRT
ncbi:hypothetical protein B0H14DRAFT_3872619 [Mycena olivaceomarginata]|nr:hypothetical protein B0H14DRAFT_3872619 [Mycena olivaceomarginata]